jgi:hypothetical protein
MESQQSESPFLTFQATASLMIFLSRIFALPMTVLLHVGYGSRFLGLSGAAAVVPFLIIPLAFPHKSPGPLMVLLALYIGRCALGRIAHLYRFFRGRLPTTHTRYAGTPWLSRLLPNWSENALLWIEPAGVFVLGMGLVWVSPPLGCYLVLSAIGQTAWRGVACVYAMNTTMDMHDAALEQKANAERFREMQAR